MNKKWTDQARAYIVAHYNYKTDLELSQGLQEIGALHTLASVRKFRQRLALKKGRGRPKKEQIAQ